MRGTEVLERENHKLRKDLEELQPGTNEHRKAKARLDEVTLALIDAHRDVIDGVARTFSRTKRGAAYKEDIESAATLGFLVALTTHDPDRGPLGYLAGKRVRTEVNNLVRQTERPWLSTRRWKTRQVAVTLSRDLPIHKVAKELGVEPSDVTRLINEAVILSIGPGGTDSDMSLAELQRFYGEEHQSLESLFDEEELARMLAVLSPTEQVVFMVRFQGRPGHLVTFGEMAGSLGTSRELCRRRYHSAALKIERWITKNRPELIAGREKTSARSFTRATNDEECEPLDIAQLLLDLLPSAQFEHSYFQATA